MLGLGLRRSSVGGMVMTLLGAALVHRGASGHCVLYAALDTNTQQVRSAVASEVTSQKAIRVDKSVTINKTPQEIYRFWRQLENLPRIMSHLKSVEEQAEGRSHWTARGPVGISISWDAEITDEQEGKRIAWRSLEGATVRNEGSVDFKEAPAGRGTEVRVRLEYHPPAGVIGAAVAKLFGEEPSQQIAEDLRRFKRQLETGEIATTDGQSSGRA